MVGFARNDLREIGSRQARFLRLID